MQLWMDVMRDIEHILDDHEALFDAWEAGGVDGLVIGPMQFEAAKLLPGHPRGFKPGRGIATFDPNPAVYQRFGVTPPPPPEADPEKRRKLENALTAAKERGWSLWIYQPSVGAGPGGEGHILADEQRQAAACARMVDTLEHYPMVDGAVMDGPEWGYEIAPHHMDHRSYIFNDLPESIAPLCRRLGYDYEALVQAKDRLYERLHTLSPNSLRRSEHGGLLGAIQLLGDDPNLFAWLAFRKASLTAYFRGVRATLDQVMSRPIRLGVGPRSAAFAPLCGYDFPALAECMDTLLPKHYFWHRGFDGMVGTVYRYVQTLVEWNPGLSDRDALSVVEALFGLRFPGVSSRADLEHALTPEFFKEIVAQETRKALAAVDDPERIVPWLEAGRTPHNGDPITAAQLDHLLDAAQGAGLRRFLYHHHGNLTPAEWSVISRRCGEAWDPMSSPYTPPDESVL